MMVMMKMGMSVTIVEGRGGVDERLGYVDWWIVESVDVDVPLV